MRAQTLGASLACAGAVGGGSYRSSRHWERSVMEKMPYQPEGSPGAGGAALAQAAWRVEVPVLRGTRVTLREVEPRDAVVLASLLTSEDVTRYLKLPPPATAEGFERFAEWAQAQRAAGILVCFGLVPRGQLTPVGIIQARSLEPGFQTAEWGFVVAPAYWGTGLFLEAAELVLEFLFETVRVHRLEARADVENGRGNGALRKLGAVQEGILRRAVCRHGRHYDQVLWSILDEQWRQRRSAALC